MNFHTNEWIMKNLQNHYDYVKEHITQNEIIGVFLHGSQNYGLDFETSDVDSVCLVMPSKYDITSGHEPMSKELVIEETNERIVVWEIRKFINFLEKGGFNQLEILYTNYYILNSTYRPFWQYINNHRADFTYLNERRTANSFLGMINRCANEIKKDNTNTAKEYMRISFFMQCLKRYLDHISFDSVLFPPNSDDLKHIRTASLPPKESIIFMLDSIKNVAIDLINEHEFNATNEDNCIIDCAREILFNILKETVFMTK